MSRKIFLLIDGHALIYRAFFGFPKDLTTPTGQLINAVFGFSRILLTAIRSLEPTYMAVAFDHPKPTKRHSDFADYKANRPTMPEDLRPQVDIVKKVVAGFNMPQFEQEGYEADDLIGTINQRVETADPDLVTVILTGDKDMFQLVDNNTQVYLPARMKMHKDIQYDEKAVLAKMGVTPRQITDLKGLMGDASDNIPGVRGVGPKTASGLIQAFHTIEGVYQALEAGEKHPLFTKSVVQKLTDGKDSAFASKQLATIMKDAPIEFDLENCRVSSYDKEGLTAIFQELNFQSLLKALPQDAFEASVQEALF